MSKGKGKYIIIEGTEGSGKTTQLNLLQQRYPKITFTREPGGTALGQQIRQILLDSPKDSDSGIRDRAELLLFMADRAQHIEEKIKPALESGEIVISDRGYLSTLAYQGYGRGQNPAIINQLNRLAMGGIQPDLVIWLDVSPDVGLQRVGKRGAANRIDSENLAFHQRVHAAFKLFAEKPGSKVFQVDGDRPEKDVFASIVAILEPLF